MFLSWVFTQRKTISLTLMKTIAYFVLAYAYNLQNILNFWRFVLVDDDSILKGYTNIFNNFAHQRLCRSDMTLTGQWALDWEIRWVNNMWVLHSLESSPTSLRFKNTIKYHDGARWTIDKMFLYVFLLKCQQASKVQRTPIWRVSPSVTQCHAASRQTSVILSEADLLNMMYSLKILSQNMWDVCTAVGLDGKKFFNIFNISSSISRLTMTNFHFKLSTDVCLT